MRNCPISGKNKKLSWQSPSTTVMVAARTLVHEQSVSFMGGVTCKLCIEAEKGLVTRNPIERR